MLPPCRPSAPASRIVLASEHKLSFFQRPPMHGRSGVPHAQVEEIHTTLRKHLRKEEEQLLPLLLSHFSAGEQAELVAQFLCSIPLSTVEVGAGRRRQPCCCCGLVA
jgi:hypothetical protein